MYKVRMNLEHVESSESVVALTTYTRGKHLGKCHTFIKSEKEIM